MRLHRIRLLSILLAVCVQAAPAQQHWAASWASAQQIPESANALAPTDLTDSTLRQIVPLSAGGSAIRVRVSNAFGVAALHVTGVHIARSVSAASSQIDPATDRPLTFDGAADVTIPPAADYWSDPSPCPSPPAPIWASRFIWTWPRSSRPCTAIAAPRKGVART